MKIQLPAIFKRNKEESPKCKYTEIPFEHLAPLDSANDPEVFKALDYALSQDCIHNIAVTGNYGSGKSSVLNTYIKTHKKHKFLNISLATFTEEVKQQGNGILPETTIQKIEKSILQQIFYSASASKLPDSSFLRIHKNSCIKKLCFEFLILCILLPFLLIFQNDIVLRVWNFITGSHPVWYFMAGGFLIAALIVLYFIISFFFKMRFIKFSFQKIELGLDSVKEESLLNRYIDEILYFFEKTKYNVVVIEDLDRFKNTEIFIKLRELNTLLNQYEKIKRNIVFIYALKDEVFKDHSRTKFFEFIIPIIPVVNIQNSCDIFFKLKEKYPDSILKDLSDGFLHDLGLYIDDMRIVKNCINEFKIYDRKINATDYMVCDSKKEGAAGKNSEDNSDKHGVMQNEDCCEKTIANGSEKKESAGSNNKELQIHNRDKLFALIVYKNLYPDDFAKLSQNQGDLAEIFKRKKDIVQNELKSIEKEISELEAQIQEVEKQIDLDIAELRTIYVAKILESTHAFAKNEISTFIKDVEFHKIKETNTIFLTDCDPRRYGNAIAKSEYKINFSEIERKINPSLSYDEREEIIRKGKTSKIRQIQALIVTKQRIMNTSHIMSFNQLIDAEIPVEKFTENVPDNKKDFIAFLLRNEYIDENYFDYISYFYEGAISATDKEYLLLIKNRKSPLVNLQLTKIENVIKRINSEEWTIPSVLNYSLLTYLLEKKDSHITDFLHALIRYKKEQKNSFFSDYESLIDSITLLNDENLSFFSNYENRNPEHLKYLYEELYKIIQYQSELITLVFQNENLDIKYYFFIYGEIDRSDRDAIAFLESDISFLHRTLDENKAIIQSKIFLLSLTFNLQQDTVNYDIFDIIIKNNAYTLIRENFDIILRFYDKELSSPISDYYTRILSLPEESIKNYVNDKLQVFIEKIILPLETLSESGEALISLLNSPSISDSDKVEIIGKNTGKISDITMITETDIEADTKGDAKTIDVWEELFKLQIVVPTWKNVFEFFRHKKNVLDEILINFINKKEIVDSLVKIKPLSDEEIKQEIGNSSVCKQLYDEVMICPKLSDESYKQLMNICPWFYNHISQYNISAEKLEILIRGDKFAMTDKNYNGIKNSHGDLLPLFIQLNFDDFLTEKDKLQITKEDLKLFLEKPDLNNDQKSKLLSEDFAVWKTMNTQDDLLFLGKKIMNIGFEGNLPVAVTSIFNVFSESSDIIKLLGLQGQKLNADIIKSIINNKLGNEYKQCIEHTGKKQKFAYTPEAEKLFTLLKSKGFISSFTIDKEREKITVNQKRR